MMLKQKIAAVVPAVPISAPMAILAASAAAAAPVRLPAKSESLRASSKPAASSTALHALHSPAHTAARSKALAEAAKLARRDRVVLEHLALVKAIAVRVHENLPVHVELDDLIHAGILGLFDAATKFNPEKQVAFSSYAKHRIKGAILDSLRQLDWASRDMRRRHKQVETATRELAAALQRTPTEQEIADKLGMEVERLRNMMIDLRNIGLVSASTRSNESEDLPAPDFPSKPETHPDSICAREQLRSVLGVAMKTLPERYQKVVVLYYTNEMTMKEIGGILGINESRVSQIHKAALEKMASALESNGITSSQAF
jgi:RNA polymerase sigma factor for flagellar operon FliA